MEKQEETKCWLKFFKDANIPKKSGATYAHIFVENRIHQDMLPDLTVDHLRLMGITLMGDIIAIMRHCKSVHQDSVRKVVILQSKDEPEKMSVSESESSSSDESSSESDVEMVSIIKNPVSTKPTNKKNLTKSERSTETKQVKSQVVSTKVAASKHRMSVIEEEKQSSADAVKRRHDEDDIIDHLSQEGLHTITSNNPDSATSILKLPAAAEKKKRVEDEIGIFGPKLPPCKKTVFERLAEPPQVSSTTEVSPTVETKFTRIISVPAKLASRSVVCQDDSVNNKSSTVFKRLGVADDRLRYDNLLTTPRKRRLVDSKPKIIRGTMRADDPEVPVKLRASIPIYNLKTSVDIKGRLKMPVLKHRALNVRSQGIFANESQMTNVSVKTRLGTSSLEVPSKSSIKERLNRMIPQTTKMRSSNLDSDKSISARLGRLNKNVTFGKVEKKLIFPIGLNTSSLRRTDVKGRVGIHSRLGTGRYS